MNAPGSPSSALQMTYFSVPGALRQKSHFMPVGKPAAAAAVEAGLAHFFNHLFGLACAVSALAMAA